MNLSDSLRLRDMFMHWDRFRFPLGYLINNPDLILGEIQPAASMIDTLYCLRIVQLVFVCTYLALLIYSVANPGWWLHLSYSLGLNYIFPPPIPQFPDIQLQYS